MYQYSDIRKIHLEISSRCNAACPGCPRNFQGYPFNDGYVEHDMTLDEAKKIFPPGFLAQLKEILINGNYGDIVMNPHGADIVEYFKQTNPEIQVVISTNGGARNREFWQRLAKANTTVYFCIDGLDDTLHLYRQNVLYSTVMANAKEYINAGGQAGWKMIRFDHNQHQIEQARLISQDMGFHNFLVVDNDRGSLPVYDRNGNLTHTIDGGERIELADQLKRNLADNRDPKQYFKSFTIKQTVNCEVKNEYSLYVTSTGEVYPCCYMGFSPRTLGTATKHLGMINQQTVSILGPNNALEHPMEECIKWFSRVVESWDQPSYEQGRLLVCDISCGS